jgi:hypothetical protein
LVERSRAARRVAAVLGVAIALTACGLQSVTDDEATEAEFTDRLASEPGDIERSLGEAGEVYGREATLVAVERVEEFNEIDNEGYAVLDVSVRNVASVDLPHHRGDWTLELPDGRRVSTAPVEGRPQLRTGEFEPGDAVDGSVVFAVGDLEGPFFVVFMPREHRNDADDRARVVWGFSLE